MVHRKVICYKIIKGSILYSDSQRGHRLSAKSSAGECRDPRPVPPVLRETEPLAPSSLALPHPGEQHQGPGRTTLGRQLRAHNHDLSRLARRRMKDQVGGALSRLSRACVRPPSLNSGSETAWLWNLHTVTAELSKGFLPFLRLLTLPVPWAGTQAVTFVELTAESVDRDRPGQFLSKTECPLWGRAGSEGRALPSAWRTEPEERVGPGRA